MWHRQQWVWQQQGRSLGLRSRKSFPESAWGYKVRIQWDRKAQTGCHMGQRHGENFTQRDPFGSFPVRNRISVSSQRTASAVTQVLFRSTRPGGHPWPPSFDRSHNREWAEIMPRGSWKQSEAESEWGQERKSGALSYSQEAHSWPWILSFWHHKYLWVASTCHSLKWDLKFPDQGLKPGFSAEPSPLDQEGQWPVSRPWVICFVERNFNRDGR